MNSQFTFAFEIVSATIEKLNICNLGTDSEFLSRIYISALWSRAGSCKQNVDARREVRELGYDVSFSSFGEATDFLRHSGFRCEAVPPLSFLGRRKAPFRSRKALQVYHTNSPPLKTVEPEIRNIAAFRPDLVISDSRLSPLIISKPFIDTFDSHTKSNQTTIVPFAEEDTNCSSVRRV